MESELGLGSTFTVHLPFGRVSRAQTRLPASFLPAGKEYADRLRGMNILVAEDNPVNQLLVRKVLEKVACKIDIASNGKEAVDCVRIKKYDVILMDVQMPEMDGYEATRYIRTELLSPQSEVPIIAMTAHAFGADVTRCIGAGMNDYISKPFKADDLYSKISKYYQSNDYSKIINLEPSGDMMKYQIDMTPIYKLGNGDVTFLNELIVVYDKQTPAFVEKLRGYVKSHNPEAIKSVCNQIKSSYGLLKMDELDNALRDIIRILQEDKPDFPRMTNLVNIVISLISAINEELKRSLRKTG
jgi:CheY-like chemotaxis protein